MSVLKRHFADIYINWYWNGISGGKRKIDSKRKGNHMGTHIVKDGNSFYEIDEDCLCAKQRRKEPEGVCFGGGFFEGASAEERKRRNALKEKWASETKNKS